MDKSIIWIVKLLSNYDVCINSRDKKALLACYPKNKIWFAFIKNSFLGSCVERSSSPLQTQSFKIFK
jgi:hypothetical protein